MARPRGFDRAQALRTAMLTFWEHGGYEHMLAHHIGLEVDAAAGQLRLDLEVLSLPENGTPTEDSRVQLTFTGVGRVAASLRQQNWDDVDPKVLPLELGGLDEAIRSFGGGRLHGWEFIDLDDSGWALWSELLSFDTKIDVECAS